MARLTKEALKAINKPIIRMKIGVELECVERTVITYIRTNSSRLTETGVLAIIEKETGLKQKEILENSDSETEVEEPVEVK